jgi:hypothetical protein
MAQVFFAWPHQAMVTGGIAARARSTMSSKPFSSMSEVD